jgi:hypothetical protein
MALYTLLKPFPIFTKIREYLPEVENLVSDSLEGIRLHGYIDMLEPLKFMLAA